MAIKMMSAQHTRHYYGIRRGIIFFIGYLFFSICVAFCHADIHRQIRAHRMRALLWTRHNKLHFWIYNSHKLFCRPPEHESGSWNKNNARSSHCQSRRLALIAFFQGREAARSNCFWCCVCARTQGWPSSRVRYYMLCRWFDDSFGTDNSALCIPFQCPAQQCSQYSSQCLTFLHDKVNSMISRGKSMFLFIRSIAAIT